MPENEIPVEAVPKLPAEQVAKRVVETWRPLWWLPCELVLQVPVAHFTVRQLLRLDRGSVVSTRWSRSSEVPIYANGQRIGSSEFEAVGEHIGARITELV